MISDNNLAPVLLYGDYFVCRNDISEYKQKNPNYNYVSFIASENNMDQIRAEISYTGWDDIYKVVVIEGIPDKKKVRDFLLNITSVCKESIKIILWDSLNHIKSDPKTKTLNKTSRAFIDEFKKNTSAKIINNGEDLGIKTRDDAIVFVQRCFKKRHKSIENDEAGLLLDIVGYDRGILISEIDKFCVNCSDLITSNFIIENAFAFNSEIPLYQLSNSLDNGSYDECVDIISGLIENEIHPILLAEVIAKKARWRLAAISCWSKGMSWQGITNKLMAMGQFPSFIWHHPDLKDKKEIAEKYKGEEGMLAYLVGQKGIPRKYIGTLDGKSERIPFEFQAEQTVSYLKRVIKDQPYTNIGFRNKILTNALDAYLYVQGKMVDVREENAETLYLMARRLI